MKNVKHLIAMFYVALMLFFKVAGLHALSHHGDETDVQHCELCDITTAVSFTPLLETETPVLQKTTYYILVPKVNDNESSIVFYNKYLASYIQTRPPPQIV